MKSFYYNIDDAEFVDAAGEKIPRCVPELFYQEHAAWRIFLRDRENRARDLSGVVAWSAAVDCDYRSDAAPMCRTPAEKISVDTSTGAVTVALDAATAEFLAAVGDVSRRRAFFELCGFNSDGERELCLEFEIAARMIIDPDPGVSPETPETLATKSYVSAVIGSAAGSAYSAARAGISDAIASGGYVDSSGARTIAENAAASAASGAIVSGAEFATSVGDYRLTYGSGGFLVSGGGVAFQVSSGAVTALASSYDEVGEVSHFMSFSLTSGALIASGASGERVVMSGGTVDARVDDGEDHQGHVNITNGGVSINASDATNDANVLVAPGQVAVNGNDDFGGIDFTVNGHPIMLDAAIDGETTSATIGVLSGGTSYIYTQPLTSLSVASVASSMQEAWLEFTVASGGSVSINASGYKYLGGRPSAFEGGSSYAVGFRWGRQAVCVPLEG